jgi:hypothetical protein
VTAVAQRHRGGGKGDGGCAPQDAEAREEWGRERRHPGSGKQFVPETPESED